MPTVNYPPATKTISKTHSSKQQIPGNGKIVIQKWTNVSFPLVKSFTPLLEDNAKPIKTQALQNKTDCGTVNNSMNDNEQPLPGIDQITQTILPNFNEFKSILRGDNDTDQLPGIDQITKITLPSCAEILGQDTDYTGLSQDEDTVPSINYMLPYDIFNNNPA